MIRKCVFLAVTLAMVFSLSACGPSPEKATLTPTPTPSTAPTESADGPEIEISEDWIIDNETVFVTSEQPINFAQTHHEQHKIIVKNGGYLKIIDSYIRSGFRFLLSLMILLAPFLVK